MPDRKRARLKIKKIFLDTNIILDYLELRNNQSINLVEKIKEKKITCYCSMFLLLELLDVQKDTLFFNKLVLDRKATVNEFLRERYNKNLRKSDFEFLNEKLDSVIESLTKFIRFYELNLRGWEMALYISSQTNLSSQDILHLSTAITLNCDVMVTRDGNFIKESKLLIRDKDFLKSFEFKKDFMHFLTPEQLNKLI